MKSLFEKLSELKSFGSKTLTEGLSFQIISDFCQKDQRLSKVIHEAYDLHLSMRKEFKELLKKPEEEQIHDIQSRFLNFYAPETVNPYIALAARGPWIITSAGAVIYDTGGYGMLGFGHSPQKLIEKLADPYPMANIMTPNFWQKRLSDALDKEIGHNRSSSDKPVYQGYLCLNSGSEVGTLAGRIGDILAKEKGKNKRVKLLGLKGGFHGRTEKPAQASDSSHQSYKKHLKSFESKERILDTIEPNDCAGLRATFVQAEKDHVFYELFFMEPVMGEGDPGRSITSEFYKLARELTQEHGTLLVVDSVQAGLRAQGVLSFVDYPGGFTELPPPDMEVFSKALNGGQFPMSLMALGEKAMKLYQVGLYGNTMTTNPRAMMVAHETLTSITPKLRQNIISQGAAFIDGLLELQKEFPQVITKVQGTGLLISAAMDKTKISVVGFDGLEMRLRKMGLGIIHGGENALRLTPVFDISKEEVHLVIHLIRQGIQHLLEKQK